MATEPASSTLSLVIDRLRTGAVTPDPDLAARVNAAFSRHERGLRAFCRRELARFSEAEVEEVVQDVFLIAWRKLPGFRQDAQLRTFLWGIALRRCAGFRRKRRDVLVEDGVLDELPDPEHRSVLTRLEGSQRDELMEEAANRALDPDQRELVRLRWVFDYPAEEVAARLGLADRDEVRKRLFTCRRKLTRELERLIVERGITASILEDPTP